MKIRKSLGTKKTPKGTEKKIDYSPKNEKGGTVKRSRPKAPSGGRKSGGFKM